MIFFSVESDRKKQSKPNVKFTESPKFRSYSYVESWQQIRKSNSKLLIEYMNERTCSYEERFLLFTAL